MALGGGYIPVFGGNITMPIVYGMKILALDNQINHEYYNLHSQNL